jgi:hypothetical protein
MAFKIFADIIRFAQETIPRSRQMTASPVHLNQYSRNGIAVRFSLVICVAERHILWLWRDLFYGGG